jgi:putative oxidoreductase
MPEALYPWMHLVGRILFSMVFILSGINHLTNLKMMTGYTQSKGLPAPKAVAAVSGVVIIVAGALLIVGHTRFIAAGVLFLFLLGTSFIFHPFWKETDPMAKMNEMTHFLKDMALAGAALFIAYYGGHPWPMSLGG